MYLLVPPLASESDYFLYIFVGLTLFPYFHGFKKLTVRVLPRHEYYSSNEDELDWVQETNH